MPELLTAPLTGAPVTDDPADLVAASGGADRHHVACAREPHRPHRGFQTDLVATADGCLPPKRLSAAGHDAPPLVFRSVRHAVLFRDRGFVADGHGAMIAETVAAHRHVDPGCSQLPEFAIDEDGRARLRSSDASGIGARVTEPVLFANHGSFLVYGHFLFETASSAFALRSLIRDGRLRVLTPRGVAPWPAEVLEVVGVPPRALFSSPHRHIAFDNLIVSSTCSGASTFAPGSVMCALAKHVTASLPRTNERRRLYLSREGAKMTSARLLANEIPLFTELRKLGFVAIEPGALSFRDQIRIFSEAEIVVGLHGSAFANIIFSRPGCIVVDILPEHWADVGGGWVQNVTNLFKQQYVYIVSQSIAIGHGHAIVADVDLVVDRVRRALRMN